MWYCLHNSSFPLPKLRSFTQCSWKRSFLTSQLFVSNNPYNRNHHVTWGEDIRVEADIESCVADGAHCLTGIQDHFTAFGVCLCLGPKTKFKIFKKKYRNVKGDYVRQVMSKCVKISSDLNCSFTSNYLFTHQYTTAVQFISPWSQQSTHHHSIRTTNPRSMIGSHRLHKSRTTRLFLHFKTPLD